MLTSTGSGTLIWTTPSTSLTNDDVFESYTIGTPFQGGVIAYILQPGDPGYVANSIKGIIAAASDEAPGLSWNDVTASMASKNTGGYNDWRLPSKDELNKLYINRIAIGNFSPSDNDYFYLSATESTDDGDGYGSDFVWAQYFRVASWDLENCEGCEGTQYNSAWKNNEAYNVRAIRSFQTGITLKSTVTGSSLTSVGTLVAGAVPYSLLTGTVPTFNQNTTGNAATATLATTATNAGTATTTTGNAGTATKLATARTINGVAFDGTGNITITASSDAGTLTGTTLNATVTGSSLTSVGTLNSATVNGKVIVGASSAASASAVLEASSTTQGFLPPRMNYYQRTQITLPVAGLTIWCSNCGVTGEMQVFNGSAWTNMIGGTTTGVNPPVAVGNSYQGGKVAYILASGDPGYDANTQHGLIAATSDQSTGIQWYNGSNTTTGATSIEIGQGLANTNAIIASQGATTTSYAAGLARAYAGGGYNDWYLPSRNELDAIRANKYVIGGFATGYYWSSSENWISLAWTQYFISGFGGSYHYPTGDFKYYTYYVRAIRAF